MCMKQFLARGTALAILGGAAITPVAAQTVIDQAADSAKQAIASTTFTPQSMTFQGTSRETWRTLMIVFAAIGIIGIIDDDSALVVVGVAGLAVCFIESGPHFAMDSTQRRLGLVNSGPFSFGLTPFSKTTFSLGSAAPPSKLYAQLTFKF